MIKVEPYLNFEGNCMEAFEFYRSVFGGEFSGITRYKDAVMEFGEEDKERVMHISLPIGGIMLMGGDVPSTMKLNRGNDISITLSMDDQEQARRIFKALSEGGSHIYPLEKTFWAELFGMFTDKYGTRWLMNYGY